jgi:hypothetical protein
MLKNYAIIKRNQKLFEKKEKKEIKINTIQVKKYNKINFSLESNNRYKIGIDLNLWVNFSFDKIKEFKENGLNFCIIESNLDYFSNDNLKNKCKNMFIKTWINLGKLKILRGLYIFVQPKINSEKIVAAEWVNTIFCKELITTDYFFGKLNGDFLAVDIETNPNKLSLDEYFKWIKNFIDESIFLINDKLNKLTNNHFRPIKKKDIFIYTYPYFFSEKFMTITFKETTIDFSEYLFWISDYKKNKIENIDIANSDKADNLDIINIKDPYDIFINDDKLEWNIHQYTDGTVTPGFMGKKVDTNCMKYETYNNLVSFKHIL